MRNNIIQAQIAGQAFALCPRTMESLLDMANQDTLRAESVSQVANNSVTFEKKGEVAVISIDGGMYKKDIGGMCSSVASYTQMIKFIDQAENDPDVSTVLYRVDTPGGAVAGADEVGDKIFNSKKKTVTLYENIGASGGMWIFSASDELYATETTLLGSVGVIVSYMESTGDSGQKRVSIVSKNAENKDCSLKGDCKEKTQSMLDQYEAMFYARLERNTGFTAEQIKSTFNNGDVIFARAAEEAGFIKEVITFDSLLNRILNPLGASPTVIIDAKSKSQNQEQEKADMDDSTIVAKLKGMLGLGEAGVETAAVDLQASLDNAISALATQTEATVAIGDKLVKAEQQKEEMLCRLQEAVQSGVSAETALAMVQADSAESASKLVLEAKASEGRTIQSEATSSVEQKMSLLDYAKANKGSVK